MSESLIGRKIRLTGSGWLGSAETPGQGSVHTIIEPEVSRREPGAVYFEHADWTWYAHLNVEPSDDAERRDWAAELVDEKPVLEVRPYAVGFLDGLLGLEMQDADDDYERGYHRGVETGGVL